MGQVKKLYKVEDEAKLAGVCQGLAEYMNLDVGLVRVVTAILILMGTGLPLLAYIVMALVLPDKKEVMKEFENDLNKEEIYPKNKKNKKSEDVDEYSYNEDDYKF